MPNHVTNILTIEGQPDEVKDCFARISGNSLQGEDDGVSMLIDFNRIIQRPDSLNITSGTRLDDAVAVMKNDREHFRKMLEWNWIKAEGLKTVDEVYEHFRKTLTPEQMEQGRMAIENERLYGCKDWYDWSIKYWGTKWNAYGQLRVSDNSIQFDTAWSTPFPVMQGLSRMFPTLKLHIEYADEDLGNNCGSYELSGGVLISEFQPKPEHALAFACEVKGIDRVDVLLNNIWGCSLEYFKKCSDTLIEIMEKDRFDELVDGIDHETEEGNEKLRFLEQIAVEHEFYEFAQICKERTLTS